MEELNNIELLEIDSSKRKESCSYCSKDFKHNDVVLKFIEYVKEEMLFEEDCYDNYESLFCCKECMINYIIKYSENFKVTKIKEYNSKSKENESKIKSFERMLEDIKVNESIQLYDFDIFCFEKAGRLKYLVNDSYIRTLTELKSYIIRSLKSKGIIY